MVALRETERTLRLVRDPASREAAELLRELGRYLRSKDYEIPVITTPDELMGE
jgi:hypothetical protein